MIIASLKLRSICGETIVVVVYFDGERQVIRQWHQATGSLAVDLWTAIGREVVRNAGIAVVDQADVAIAH